MLLAIDVGNTQTQFGLFENDTFVCDWRIATNANSTADELLLMLENHLAQQHVACVQVTQIVLASVVPRLTHGYHTLSKKLHSALTVTEVTASAVSSFLGFAYPNASEIGADRIANAVAAKALYGAPVIVVDYGTATNIDVVDAEGNYAGGALAPGIEISSDALFERAARLSSVELRAPLHALATNTSDALRSGIIFGEAERTDGLVNRILCELGYVAPVIATGGIAPLIAPHAKTIQHIEPNLTIQGLLIIGQNLVC